jgi:long-chain acyl-CoA synthetase
MYPGKQAKKYPKRPAFIMASTGEKVSYKEFEDRSNRLAHYLRSQDLKFQDHYSIFMENNNRFLETNSAGERAGLYYTCINSYLKADELAYIINNSDSKVLITSISKLEVVREAVKTCPELKSILVVDANDTHLGEGMYDYFKAVQKFPPTPIDQEGLGAAMLYSSGTTGRPKGILRPLPEQNPEDPLPIMKFLSNLWNYSEDMIYLSPAPLYHSAPQAATGLALRQGATIIIMERFEPLEFLSLIEKYKITHSQLVPTMFSRMLKLSDEEKSRYDISSLKYALHAAAPCPEKIKTQMIDWWGPIICEYYGATEAFGFAYCDTKEWLEHPGTVGKIMIGELQILDDDMQKLPRVSLVHFGLNQPQNLITIRNLKKLQMHTRMIKL